MREPTELDVLRSTVVGEIGARYYTNGNLPLEAASRQAADLVDRLISAVRSEPVAGASADRPEVTWDDLKPGRLMVVTDRSSGKPEQYDVRIVKRGNRVGGRVTLRALTGSREWVLYIDTQRSKSGWQSFRSPEQVAWDDRQSAARTYLRETIGPSSSNRGLYESDEVTLANILRRARGEEEL